MMLCATFRLYNRILGLVIRHLAHDDLIYVQSQLVEHILAVNNDVSQFLLHVLKVILGIAPLKAFEQFIGFDGYGLGKVGRGMKLIPVPVPVCCEFPDPVYCFLLHTHFSKYLLFRTVG